MDDWQLTKTMHSYEGSKFQMDLVASELERLVVKAEENFEASSLPDFVTANGAAHHLISSPGVVPTNMMALLGTTSRGQKASAAFVFWIVSLRSHTSSRLLTAWCISQTRLLGCRHIHLSTYSSAVATVHLALAPLKSIPTARTAPLILPTDEKYPTWHPYHDLRTQEVQTLRIGSEADRWGNEYPGIIAVPVWEDHRDFGGELLEKCERLYQTFRTATRAPAEDGAKDESSVVAD